MTPYALRVPRLAGSIVVSLAVAAAAAIFAPSVSAQTCPYDSTQGTCACPTQASDGSVTCFGGQLYRASDSSCQNDPRPCSNPQKVFVCSTLSCVCPAGTTLCSATDTCVANRVCPPGTTWNVCTDTCGTQNVLLNPDPSIAPQPGDVKVNGDFYLSNGKAYRVDGAGNTQLNLGNWGSGATGFTMRVFGRFLSDGDLGVGVTNPLAKLHLKQTTVNQGIYIEDTDTTNVAEIALDGDATADLFIRNGGGDIRILQGNTATDLFRMTNAGLVGIGTSSPAGAKVQIHAPVSTEALRLVTAAAWSPFNIRNSTNTADIFRVDQTGTLAVGSVPWARLTSFPSSGAMGYWSRSGQDLSPATANDRLFVMTNILGTSAIYGNSQAANGTGVGGQGGYAGGQFTSTDGFGVLGTSNTQNGVQGSTISGTGGRFVASGAGNGIYATSATGYAGIFDAGNVGIGTTAPTAKLDVNGTAKMTGFQLTTSPGAGKVLKSDAAGVGTWQTDTSIGGGGTTNYVAKFTGAATIGNSQIFDNGTNVGIGTSTPNNKLQVAGLINFDNTALGTFIGYNAGAANSGNYNAYVGYESGALNSTGFYNTGLGYRALYANTTGAYNTSVGTNSLLANIDATNNTAVGWGALQSATSGGYNNALGRNALAFVSTGTNNVGIGYQAGDSITTGTNNTFVGHGSDASAAGLTNATAIGAGAVVAASNALVLGNGANVGIGATAPGAKLEVVGPATGSGITIRASGGGDVVLNAGGSLFFDGNYSYAGGNYIRPIAANTQQFVTGGVERMRITSAGDVGIGQSAPGAKLDVNGTVRMTGFQLGTSATAGQVLTANASGVGTWQAIPSQVPSGSNYQMQRHNGTTWVATSAIEADDTNIGIGIDPSLFGVNAYKAVIWETTSGKDALRSFSYAGDGVFAQSELGDGLSSFSIYGIGAFVRQGNPLTQNATMPTLYVSRGYTLNGYDATAPVVRISDVTTASGDLMMVEKMVGASMVDMFRITDTGNVGVYTASPTERLDVNGRARIRGQYIQVDGSSNRQAYIGDDGAGNDIELGSRATTVTNIGFWNTTDNRRMNIYAGDVNLLNDGTGEGAAVRKINFSGQTGNQIIWNTAGVAAPAFTTRSDGTKLVLYPAVGASTVDYGLGIEGSTLWYSVPSTSSSYSHKFYGGTTELMRIYGNADVSLSGKHAFRSSDSWLRLNQDGAFTSGTHTPGNFAPGALNVGGAGGWGNPGGGNAWFTGSIGVGTTSLAHKVEVYSTGNAFRAGSSSSWFEMWTGGNSRLSFGNGSGYEAGFIASSTSGGNNLIVAGCSNAGSCPAYTRFYESGTVSFGGDISAESNSWGGGYGWVYCGGGGDCTCADGYFVGRLWNSGQYIYCYHP